MRRVWPLFRDEGVEPDAKPLCPADRLGRIGQGHAAAIPATAADAGGPAGSAVVDIAHRINAALPAAYFGREADRSAGDGQKDVVTLCAAKPPEERRHALPEQATARSRPG